MRSVILDTSFIMMCVRQKVDFFHWLEKEGMKIYIPEQVLRELKGLGQDLALKLIKIHKFNLVKLQSRDADTAIIKFAKKNPQTIVATIDRGLKRKVSNKKLVIRGKKKLEII